MYKVFIGIVVIHFIEHLTQLYQLYILHWARPECLGLISLRYPWLMKSEWLHYSFALYMLVGLSYFSYKASNKKWWRTALILQHYHHIEHLILLSQALVGIPMIERVSLGSFIMPRLELHFFYNLIVLIPMLLGVFTNDRRKTI
jgi:hypothetical protein